MDELDNIINHEYRNKLLNKVEQTGTFLKPKEKKVSCVCLAAPKKMKAFMEMFLKKEARHVK